MTASFSPGENIAMKVPPHEYEATLSFYRDILGLKEIRSEEENATPGFDFGGKVLWIDRVVGCTQAEIWLELSSPEPAKAAAYLESHGVTRCDDVEPLPKGFGGYWITSPCNIVHLVTEDNEA